MALGGGPPGLLKTWGLGSNPPHMIVQLLFRADGRITYHEVVTAISRGSPDRAHPRYSARLHSTPGGSQKTLERTLRPLRGRIDKNDSVRGFSLRSTPG